jgi:hypothetical protein
MSDAHGPLDKLIIKAHSPDGLVLATLSDRTKVELRFEPRAYRRYSAADLGAQLTQLATRLWVAYRRGYFQALSEARGETITGNERVYSPREQQFRKDQAALEVRGVSPEGWVTIHSTALVRWQVRIKPGFNRSLDEQQFLAEADAALRELLDDYFEQARQLLVKHFDLKLPPPTHQSRAQDRTRNRWR